MTDEFVAPTVYDNPDGWGPALDVPPERFRDMPYAPFSKSDRLGRAADWFSHGRYGGRMDDGEFGGDEDGAGFTLVDSRQPVRHFSFGYRPRDRNFGQRNRNWNDRGDNYFRRDFKRDGRRFGSRYDDRRHQVREPSVEVGDDWTLLEEVQFSAFVKAKFEQNDPGETLRECGSLEYYDKANERISCKMEKPLKRFEHRAFHYITTTEDPVIKELASKGEGTVFATGTILALLMASTRSAYPWDIVVQRVGDMLFFDKRDGSRIDLATVNETAHEQPKDDKNAAMEETINTIQSLALEATLINQNFSQAMLKQEGRFSFAESNPFVEDGEEEASVAYRYRRWNLGPDIKLVARCELDGAIKASGPGEDTTFLVIKALNEVMDPNMRQQTDWRSKLDTQRGAILATEVKNNAAKVARWIIQALLSGADQMQLGFVSRINPRDNTNHVVLGTQLYKPREFASQNALVQPHLWGILKRIIDICYKHIPSGGKGVIVKDPNAPILRFYSVPEDAFDDEAGGEFADGEEND